MGHLDSVFRSDPAAVEGSLERGLLPLFLPDVCGAHAELYDRLPRWKPAGWIATLVEAHMLGDWVVHFGPFLGAQPRREGWAYRRMSIAVPHYEHFFQEAYEAGLRPTAEPNDTLRGFSHTLVEYAIDTVVARSGRHDNVFPQLMAALQHELHPDHVALLVAKVPYDVDEKLLPDFTRSFAYRISMAKGPEQLTWWAGARKFGLVQSLEAARFVGNYISIVTDALDPEEVEGILELCSKVITSSSAARGLGAADSWPTAWNPLAAG